MHSAAAGIRSTTSDSKKKGIVRWTSVAAVENAHVDRCGRSADGVLCAVLIGITSSGERTFCFRIHCVCVRHHVVPSERGASRRDRHRRERLG
mmetsp:Transcript_25219/g.58265  ORF Transcript_25219/g.58265 Transcript_25219/m.58265 type:complete len:93 (+) Transcript_25219:81-359(+)